MISQEFSQPVFIVGPTASGKSAAAMEVAHAFPGAELFCLDKSTAWCEMDIGTAKPTIEDRSQVPHQLVDIFHMGYSEWWWPPGFRALNDIFGSYPNNITAIMSKEAREQLSRVRDAGKAALCVGGSSSLYASLYEGYNFPESDPWSDQRLRDLGCRDAKGMRYFLERTGAPLPFTPEHPLGIFDEDPGILFEQIVEAETRMVSGKGMQGALVIGIDVDDVVLEKRILSRTDEMIENGLAAEVKNLTERYGWCLPLRSTIGYKEFRGWFPRSPKSFSLDSVIGSINASTLRYARRQRAWLKQRGEVQWVRAPKEAADLATERLRGMGHVAISGRG